MMLLRFIGCFFSALGIAMLVGTFFLYRSTRATIAHAARAQGTVVAMTPRRGQKGGITYAPVVRFTDANGGAHQFTSSTSQSPPAYHAGEQTTVLYDAASPQEAQLSGFADLWLGSLILGGLGLVFSLVGGGLLVGSFAANGRVGARYGAGRGMAWRTRRR